MELVEALEQLSLEVRNQKFNISTELCTSEVDSTHYHPNQQYVDQSMRPLPSIFNDYNLRQLQEFDKSIETLFAQIADLDCLEPKRTIQALQIPASEAHSRREKFNYLNKTDSKAHYSGSIETSQEEDSDCSSQQSGCANRFKRGVCVNPLVKDLLKRDICAITGTVKKIGRLLAIGNQLENLHNNLFSKTKQTVRNDFKDLHPDYLQNIDANYIRSLCDEFNYLCSSEQHIRDLPTVISYNEFCCNLLALVNRLEPNSISAKYKAQQQQQVGYTEDEMFLHCTPEQTEVYDDNNESTLPVEGDEEELDNDVAFLNCDQRHVDKWTENKLYINHPST